MKKFILLNELYSYIPDPDYIAVDGQEYETVIYFSEESGGSDEVLGMLKRGDEDAAIKYLMQ